MRILLIEDDTSVANALRQGLRNSYVVDIVPRGKEGMLDAQSRGYDVILLDLNLPDMAGEEICRTLRKNDIATPIIVISGRDLTADKVSLLDMGADDYITKPFRLEEVKARIRVVLRKGARHITKSILKVSNLKLDPAGRAVHIGSQEIELRRKEFDLLEYLVRHAGQAVTRAMILEHVWETSEHLWANVVDVHIKHLRDKIDRPFGTNMIRTIHGVGYKIEETDNS